MKLDSDDFELFAVPRRFEQDTAALDARWRELQAEVHPDRFAAQGAAAQRVAMQWAVRVNEAHRRLKDPVQRAAYLCALNGVALDAENNTTMPAAFLARQMAWREALDDAGDAIDAVEALQRELRAHTAQALAELRRTLDDERDFTTAAGQVRALMFSERFAADIDRRLEALGQ